MSTETHNREVESRNHDSVHCHRPEWWPQDRYGCNAGSLLVMAETLHGVFTGAVEPVEEQNDLYAKCLRWALDNWKTPECEFDVYVRMLCQRAVLEYKQHCAYVASHGTTTAARKPIHASDLTLADARRIIDEEIGEAAAIWAGEWQCIGGGQVAAPSTDANAADGELERVAKFWSEADAVYACSMQRALRRLARSICGVVDEGK